MNPLSPTEEILQECSIESAPERLCAAKSAEISESYSESDTLPEVLKILAKLWDRLPETLKAKIEGIADAAKDLT